MERKRRMNQYPFLENFVGLLRSRPHAYAQIKGSPVYPDVHGPVRFYQTPMGVLVVADSVSCSVDTGACFCLRRLTTWEIPNPIKTPLSAP